MAFIHMIHRPASTRVNQQLNLVIPDPEEMHEVPVRYRSVLYLLHGLSDDASAWERYTMIELYARKYGLVVVMPEFGRSFYTDLPNGAKYFTYLVEELPRYLEDVFGILPGREKTLVAGLSMGGYGAMKAALLHPEKYYAAASFSGVLSAAVMSNDRDPERDSEFETIFGDLSLLPGSRYDPLTWLENAAKDPSKLPQLYVSCGLSDGLYPANLMFRNACRNLDVPLEFVEEPGGHDWFFWNEQIQQFLRKYLEPVKI